MRALIVEHGRNSGVLAAARSLRRAGWHVGLSSNDPHSVAGASRAVEWVHQRDADARDPAAVVDAIRQTITEAGYDVMFPVDESLVLALSERREELRAQFPFAPHDVLLRALDRFELAQAAQAAGLATPRTQLAGDAGVLDSLTGRAVIKARRHLMMPGTTGVGRVEAQIGTAEEIRRWAAEIEAAGGEAVVQELVAGGLAAMTVLIAPGGEVIAQEQQVSEQLWPPEAGISARARTRRLDPDLAERVLTLLRGLGWEGLVQMQFVLPKSGEPHLIDFNPRFYGSLGLAIGAGADFPALWAALATGHEVPHVVARPGVRYQWLGGDLRRAVQQRRGLLLGDVASCLAFSVGAVHYAWSWSDPLPALLSSWLFFSRRLGRRLGGRG